MTNKHIFTTGRVAALLLWVVVAAGLAATAVAQEPSSEERAKQLFEARQKRQREKAEAEEAAKRAAAEKAEAEAQAKREAEEAAKRAAEEALAAELALIAKAEAGDVDAQYKLGELYAKGEEGVRQNYDEARRWFELAAQNNNAKAMNWLGWLYNKGWGVAQDYATANEWYRKGADRGSSSSMNNLGVAYLDGRGVKADRAKARELLINAAKLGNKTANNTLKKNFGGDWQLIEQAVAGDVDAQVALGESSLDDKDIIAAQEWFELAADKRHPKALYGLAEIHFAERLPNYYSPRWQETRNFDEPVPLDYYIQAGIGGEEKALERLERYYKIPRIMMPLLKGAYSGDIAANIALGDFFLGKNRSQLLSEEFYNRALKLTENEQGPLRGRALYAMGLLYDRGDFYAWWEEAVKWLKQAAELGNKDAMWRLYDIYWNGRRGVNGPYGEQGGLVAGASKASRTLPKYMRDEINESKRLAKYWKKRAES